jgi:hypothetical protein
MRVDGAQNREQGRARGQIRRGTPNVRWKARALARRMHGINRIRCPAASGCLTVTLGLRTLLLRRTRVRWAPARCAACLALACALLVGVC